MRLRHTLTLIAALAGFVFTQGCTSNAEKLAAFCTDFHAAAEENQNDCDAMGESLSEVMSTHKGVKTFGDPDDEASRDAMKACEEGGRIIATHCAGNASVAKALESLESQ